MRAGAEDAAAYNDAWDARTASAQAGASPGADGDDFDSFVMPGEKEFEWGGGKPGYGMSTRSRPSSLKNSPIIATGGKLTPNPDGADYPSGYLEDGTQYTKHLYSDAQVGTIPVIQTPDNRVYAFPGGSPGAELQTVTVPGMSLPERLQVFTDEHIAQTNAQMERNLTALTQEMLTMEIRINPVQASLGYVLGMPGDDPYMAETIGVQSLPGTIDATRDIANAAASVYDTRHMRTSFVPGAAGGTGANITVNSRPVTGAPLVTVAYGVTRPSQFAQFGMASAGMLKKTPLLSVVGTTAEYGIYRAAGMQKNPYGDTRYTYAADVTLDVGKAAVSGFAGVAASIVTSAAIGAAGGSVVPGLGTAVGLVVGLGTGIWAAAQFEEKVYKPYGTRQNFSEYLERKFK